MILRNESLPQANIYSSKILFDQMEDRNKKRMNQILKRKKALSTQNKTVKIEEEKTDLSPKDEKDCTNINIFTQFNKSIYDFNYIQENNKKEFDIKNSLNEVNNNSTNTNSITLIKDSKEKDINISNSDENNKEVLIPEKNKSLFEKLKDENDIKENQSIVNIDIINCEESFNDECKENNNLDSKNFAIKYLSSSLNSFIKLDNHLIAKVKYQNNCFTDSYSQALELNNNDNNHKDLHSKKYLVTEIIKEEKEKEGETPLKLSHKYDKSKQNKNKNCDSNNEENDIINRMARRRAYSRRIRNNILNKNIKDEFEININKKITDKPLNTSKSCKKLNQSNYTTLNKKNLKRININKNIIDSLYYNKNNFNIISRKTICNFKKQNNLNNSFNINNNCNFGKALTAMNSSRNLANKNEKLNKNIGTSKSNLNIFKIKYCQKNKNNLNISMNNLNSNLNGRDKMRTSKSAKRIDEISNNLKNKDKKGNLLYTKLKNITTNRNSTRILKKNSTMGKITFIKKINNNKKENSPKNNNLNKTALMKPNGNKNNSFLNNTMSYRNIRSKKCIIYTKINSRNSMPFKQKATKIIKNILNTENNNISNNKAIKNRLKLNKSYCYLPNKNKYS